MFYYIVYIWSDSIHIFFTQTAATAPDGDGDEALTILVCTAEHSRTAPGDRH